MLSKLHPHTNVGNDEPLLLIDFRTSNDEEHYREGHIGWIVRIINETNNVFEKHVSIPSSTNNGNPDMEVVKKDFFANRQTYKRTGTLGDLNREAAARNKR